MRNQKLPTPLEDVNQLGRLFVTKEQIRNAIYAEHPQLVENHCVFRRFNPLTGRIEKKYAWLSVIEILNKEGKAAAVVKELLK
jgi:hypothetical protein